VEAFQKSGLTQKAFARQWDVSHVTLGAWLRSIRPVMPMFRRGGRSAILPAFPGGDHGENSGGAVAWSGA
jgi:hypothetical protein